MLFRSKPREDTSNEQVDPARSLEVRFTNQVYTQDSCGIDNGYITPAAASIINSVTPKSVDGAVGLPVSPPSYTESQFATADEDMKKNQIDENDTNISITSDEKVPL